jgi:bifunctional non-homologous end joining protein LigD
VDFQISARSTSESEKSNTSASGHSTYLLNGRDLRKHPLTKRKASLKKLLSKAADIRLRISENFEDGEKLLASAESMGLEGIVSKGRAQPYRSVRCDWIKVKCRAWRQANKNRGDVFQKRHS